MVVDGVGMSQRLCKICDDKFPVGDPRKWHDPQEWPEECNGHFRPGNVKSHQVMGDLKPYKSIITGEVIGGRKQHRDHLKAHGKIEVGNEKLKPPEYQAPKNLVQDLKRAYEACESGRGVSRPRFTERTFGNV